MIAHFDESEWIGLFLDLPACVGPPEAGVMIFSRRYGHGVELVAAVDAHAGEVSLSVSCEGNTVAHYACRTDRVETDAGAIRFYRRGILLAEVLVEPYPCLTVAANENAE